MDVAASATTMMMMMILSRDVGAKVALLANFLTVRSLSLLVAFSVGAILGANNCKACGIELDTPKNHFDGVNELGEMSYWEKIGEIVLSSKLALPLNINFSSSREYTSPYLGKSWILAPLDCNFIQLDETRFKMIQPNGSWVFFKRKNPSDSVLKGKGSWLAEIKGNTITAWSKCGDRLIFNRGKLISINVKNENLDIVYSGELATEIRKGGLSLLRVERDSRNGQVDALIVGDNRISIIKGQKPRVQMIGGQIVIGGLDPSVSEISFAGKNISKYKYEIDAGRMPTFTVSNGSGERRFAWDPETRSIVKDGEWTYRISPSKTPFQNALIERSNLTGKLETWFFDALAGKETIRNANGVKITRSWFTSGKLAGRSRSLEVARTSNPDTNLNIKIKYLYDQEGRFIGQIENNEKYMFFRENKELSLIVMPGEESLFGKKKVFIDVNERFIRPYTQITSLPPLEINPQKPL